MYRFDPTANPSPETVGFKEIARKLGELLRGCLHVDWSEDRNRCAEVLEELAQGCEKSQLLTERLAGTRYVRGGDEHKLLDFQSGQNEPRRVYKVTFGESFGCKSCFIPSDPDLMGRHFYAEVNSNPLFYLERWIYLNSITNFQTRYEGILPPPEGGTLPLICVSQEMLPQGNPSEVEIETALGRYGYIKISQNTFFERNSHILLTDVAPRNVRIYEGIPGLFDVIAEKASPRVCEWALREQ